MKIDIDGLEVLWPYDYIYPEQLQCQKTHARKQRARTTTGEGALAVHSSSSTRALRCVGGSCSSDMSKLKSTLHGGHCLLEMPTGTGKTVSLLSLILSFQYADPTMGKLVYWYNEQMSGQCNPKIACDRTADPVSLCLVPLVVCSTRTVQEMDKVVEELRRVQSYRTKVINAEIAEQIAKGNVQHNIRSPDILGVCLSSRRNLCIHPTVSKHDNRGKVDALCRNKTASFVREQKAAGADIEVCQFFEGYESEGKDATLSGIYSISDLKTLGSNHKWCPYFTSRRLVSVANVVVYNYQYLLDPKIAGMVSREISKESVVVFDEGQGGQHTQS